MAPLKAFTISMCANVYYVFGCFVLEFMADYFPQISDENNLFLYMNL